MLKKKLIISGIIVTISFVILLIGVNYLKGKNPWIKKRTYYTVYNEVGGLNIGSPVTFKGLKIGQITKIKFANDYADAVIVAFVVNRNYKIPFGSKAEIFNADLLGTKGLRITPSNSHEFYKPGDTLASTRELSLFADISNNLGPLKKKSENLLTSLDSLSRTITAILGNNAAGLNSTFANLNRISQNLDIVSMQLKTMTSKDGKITKIVNNLEQLSYTLKQNDENINNAITNISDVSDSLKAANIQQTIADLHKTVYELNSTLEQINSGNGTVGKLIYNDTLYTNLQNLTIELDSLIANIHQNPQKYVHISVFGSNK